MINFRTDYRQLVEMVEYGSGMWRVCAKPWPLVFPQGKESENRSREWVGVGIKCPEKRGQNTSDPKVLSKFFILLFV